MNLTQFLYISENIFHYFTSSDFGDPPEGKSTEDLGPSLLDSNCIFSGRRDSLSIYGIEIGGHL